MPKTKLSSFFQYGHKRRCFKCRGYFCVRCKVPWHSSLSCTGYNKFHPNPENDLKLKSLASSKGWRQCSKCKHMVERSSGCRHMTCWYLSRHNSPKELL
ncbi:unnamed protein product [Arabis nemorensis]|uniref:Uncharacterized protein n=1 Tax=Arabis nemorensis TaxID=586526 RepID=A0A565CSI9_9BRAS|nr:unnamed protein product [Arabis nemorensis]